MKSPCSRIDDTTFRKFYLSSADRDKELYIYQQKYSFTPALKDTGTEGGLDYADFEYIKSCTLWDKKENDFGMIARLYAELHNQKNDSGKVICQIDTNPRNVIYDLEKKSYLLIDFLDWRWDNPEYDVIHFLMFWASACPRAQFQEIYRSFLGSYQKYAVLSNQEWQRLLPEVSNYFTRRRQIYYKKEKKNNPEAEANIQLLSLLQ